MSIDKVRYYDGKLYGILTDRALKEVRDIIIEQIKVGSRVVDVGCGTGSLVFDLAEKCESVTGVELSSKMVNYAKHRQKSNKESNVTFVHGDAVSLHYFKDQQFDYLTISMVLHEIPSELRTKVLNEARRIAKKIIIADYVVPQPLNFVGIRTRIVEFLAGKEHFRGFRDFQNNNGIDQLLKKCQLSICSESTNQNGTIRVVVAEK